MQKSDQRKCPVVTFKRTTGTSIDSYAMSLFLMKGLSGIAMSYGEAYGIIFRDITSVTDSYIKFGGGSYGTASKLGITTDNNFGIPYKIYGIR